LVVGVGQECEPINTNQDKPSANDFGTVGVNSVPIMRVLYLFPVQVHVASPSWPLKKANILRVLVSATN